MNTYNTKVQKNYFFYSIVGIIAVSLKSSIQTWYGLNISNIFLFIGLLLINIISFRIYLEKSNLFKTKLIKIFFLLIPIELIIIIYQPDQYSFRQIIFRLICYNLCFCGALHAAILSQKFNFFNKISIFLIIFLLCALYIIKVDYQNLSNRYVFNNLEMTAVGISYSYGIISSSLLVIFYYEKDLKIKIISLAIFLLPFYICLLTGTRGYFLSILFVFLLIIFQHSNKKNLFILFLIFIILYIFFNKNSQIFDNIIFRFTATNTHSDQSVLDRIYILNFYLENWIELLPFGFKKYDGIYVHNLFLDLFIRFGIYGLFICYLILKSFINIILSKKIIIKEFFDYFVLGLVLYSFFHSQVSLTSEFLRFFWFGIFYFTFKLNLKLENKI